MQKTKLTALILALLLTSCAKTGPATKPNIQPKFEPEIQTVTTVIDTACKWTAPIFISKTDVLTDGTARQILAHNRAYEAACGKVQQAAKPETAKG
jgi:PBP1b-binding outer membrane lipoprotein LpoB